MGKCSATDVDGPLSTESYVDVDIDYPGEPSIDNKIDAWWNGYSVEYEAYAKVYGEAPNGDYEGEYECYAWVPNDEDHITLEEWDGKVDEDVMAEDSISLTKDDEEWSDADKERYGSWDTIQADTDLSSCTAWGDVDGSSPAKSWREWVKTESIGFSTTLGTTWTLVDRHRPAQSQDGYANAWNFSDPTEHNADHDNE